MGTVKNELWRCSATQNCYGKTVLLVLLAEATFEPINSRKPRVLAERGWLWCPARGLEKEMNEICMEQDTLC